MPSNQQLHEWYERVERLCALIVKRPELTWLWEIRIKILMYLIHRYGESATPQPVPTPTAHNRPGSGVPSRPTRARQPCTADRRMQIRTLLESIHCVNAASKEAHDLRQ